MWDGKVIVFTDIHITRAGETIIGLDPYERLKWGLEHAVSAHGDADCIVITGDLTDTGHAEEFARLHNALADVPLPVHLMLGNHDRREAFRAAFPEASEAGGFVQKAFDVGAWRLILLDTLDDPCPPDHHAGSLCDVRRAWLKRELDHAGDKDVVVFGHHHPFRSGFDAMDSIALDGGDWLVDTLAKSNVRLFVCGHIHRWMSGAIRGMPWVLFKSPVHQQPMTLGDNDIYASVPEPGGYGLLLLSAGQVVAHMVDFTLPDSMTGAPA